MIIILAISGLVLIFGWVAFEAITAPDDPNEDEHTRTM